MLIDKLFPTMPVKKEFTEPNKIFKRKLNTLLLLQKIL